ncbi:MAG: adenine phosphoribosyltransferase [Dysgonomonas sp.]
MSIEKLKSSVRNVPNFPIEGIQFKDVTTLFKEAENLKSLAEELKNLYKDKGITKVVGIESRGFIMGPIMALELNAGFIPIRKPGKLPAETIEESYTKEYGVDTIQIHKDALNENDVVILHDDLLATGGTMFAAYNLVKKMGVKKVYINFIIELEDLKGRELFPSDIEIESLIKYDI